MYSPWFLSSWTISDHSLPKLAWSLRTSDAKSKLATGNTVQAFGDWCIKTHKEPVVDQNIWRVWYEYLVRLVVEMVQSPFKPLLGPTVVCKANDQVLDPWAPALHAQVETWGTERKEWCQWIPNGSQIWRPHRSYQSVGGLISWSPDHDHDMTWKAPTPILFAVTTASPSSGPHYCPGAVERTWRSRPTILKHLPNGLPTVIWHQFLCAMTFSEFSFQLVPIRGRSSSGEHCIRQTQVDITQKGSHRRCIKCEGWLQCSCTPPPSIDIYSFWIKA